MEKFAGKMFYKLKNSYFVRALLKPYIESQRSRLYREYLLSEDRQKLQNYKNKFAGRRCFIIGNGPSLCVEDLERLNEECTFASNHIYKIYVQTKWRPSFYCAIDPDFLSETGLNWNEFATEQVFLDYAYTRKHHEFPKLIGIFQKSKFVLNKANDISAYISEDVSDHFSNGYTVTFNLIQLAIYMGFSEIYLLGVDFNYSIIMDKNGKIHRNDNTKDYFSGERYATTIQYYEPTLHAYKVAKDYCDSHGIDICNATRGGRLEVFPRVNYDVITRKNTRGGGNIQIET